MLRWIVCWCISLCWWSLLAPSPSALRTLLRICECFGVANYLKFNPDKTRCIRFSRLHNNSSCHFVFCGTLKCCRSVTYLGHTLTANLSDGDDIFRCSHNFIRAFWSSLVFVTLLFWLSCLPVSVCPFMVVLFGHLTLVLLRIWMSVWITVCSVYGLYWGIVTLESFTVYLVVLVCL